MYRSSKTVTDVDVLRAFMVMWYHSFGRSYNLRGLEVVRDHSQTKKVEPTRLTPRVEDLMDSTTGSCLCEAVVLLSHWYSWCPW